MMKMRQEMLKEADTNEDKVISLDEFLSWTKKSDFKKDPEWKVGAGLFVENKHYHLSVRSHCVSLTVAKCDCQFFKITCRMFAYSSLLVAIFQVFRQNYFLAYLNNSWKKIWKSGYTLQISEFERARVFSAVHEYFVLFLIEFQIFQTTEEMEEPVYTKDELREFNKKNKIHPDEYLEVRLNSKLFSWIYTQLVSFSLFTGLRFIWRWKLKPGNSHF